MEEPEQSELLEMDLEQLAKDIFNEHNYLRKNPQSYIEKLERVSSFYRGKYFRHPMEIPIETYESYIRNCPIIKDFESNDYVDKKNVRYLKIKCGNIFKVLIFMGFIENVMV